MRVFTYNTIEEFENSYQDSAVLAEHSQVMVKLIEKGFNEGKTQVDLFQIEILNNNELYTVKAKAEEWPSAVESCLKHLEKIGAVDEVIDAYQLLQKLKNK